MADVGKVAETPRREAHAFLAKAEQFLGTARAALDESQHDSALLAAIHAAVTSANAVCVTLLGARSADPDHQRAADLLATTGIDASEIRSRQLRALLKKKNLVEYEARLNYLLPRYRDDSVVCVYDTTRFSADVALDILRTHPMVILEGVL